MRSGSSFAVFAILVLAACERSAGPPGASTAMDPQPAPVALPATSLVGWRLEASATSGAALINRDARGDTRLRLACRRAPAGLYAEAPGLDRIDSEDRLTLGAGDELAVLVVSMEGPKEGLRAEGQPHPKFLAAVVEGRPLALSYGARQVELAALPPALRADFAAACAKPAAT